MQNIFSAPPRIFFPIVLWIIAPFCVFRQLFQQKKLEGPKGMSYKYLAIVRLEFGGMGGGLCSCPIMSSCRLCLPWVLCLRASWRLAYYYHPSLFQNALRNRNTQLYLNNLSPQLLLSFLERERILILILILFQCIF